METQERKKRERHTTSANTRKRGLEKTKARGASQWAREFAVLGLTRLYVHRSKRTTGVCLYIHDGLLIGFLIAGLVGGRVDWSAVGGVLELFR